MAAGKKVLVVEDSKLIRLEVRRTLEAYGLEVLELDNAEDLFRFSGRFRDISLLILDINLPGMDGLTALEKMQAEKSWAYLPVIMLTGRADRDTVKRAVQAGAVNYLRKPFTGVELLERVERVLGPLVPPEGDAVEPGEGLEYQVRREVSRSKRGGTTFSMLEISVPADLRRLSRLKELTALRDQVRRLLREIDSVFLTKDRNLLLLLPLTGAEGAAAVAEKTRRQLAQWGYQGMVFATVTFPGEGADEQELLRALQEKLFLNSLKAAGEKAGNLIEINNVEKNR